MRHKILASFVALALVFGFWFGWRIHTGKPEQRGDALSTTESTQIDAKATVEGASHPQIAPTVKELVWGSGPIQQRVLLTHGLRTNCSNVEQRALLDFLVQSNHLDGNQYGQYLKNRVMDELCEMDPIPVGLAETLITVFDDAGQHPVLRDYAVQHMASLYEQLLQTTAGKQTEHAAGKNLLREAMWKAANQPEESFAGTALLGLEKLSATTTDFDREQVASAAAKLASKEAVELNRISAMQVMAFLKVPSNLPVLLQAAESGETTMLRLSAIGALGRMESVDAIPTLAGIIDRSEPRLSKPAQIALDRINQKSKHLQ